MHKAYTTILILLAAGGLARGQATSRPPEAESSSPQPLSPAEAIQASGGSLLRASMAGSAPDASQGKLSGVSFFAVPEPEPRTLKKHDLVTIIVREESEFRSEGTTDLKREAALEAKIEQFIKLSLENGALENGVGGDPPTIKLNGSRDFKGEATVDRSDSLTLRVTAEVVDVKPNGTLVLQARQRIKTDEEEQTFILSGICRVQDLTPDNTILSTQMFDKELTKSHKGAVRDGTRRGWFTKLLDVLNPF